MLEFSGVSKRFAEGTLALADVNFAMAPGEFVSIVGPSGSGKTTLLHVAAGLQRPTGGTVRLHTDKVGYVFQDPALLPWRTVQGNVELLLELRGLPRQERRRCAAEAIELVGLADFARHRPRTLSGGMRMRVSLARSLTLDPELFLLDEPFGALDEMTRQRLGVELSRLFGTRRFGAVLVTHSVTEAVFLGSRVLVMSERPGRIIGDYRVPFDHPRSPDILFAADFTALAREIAACLAA
ncbi:MAG TPA: ABC transporter ATP-binding protein [Streptosporangiaceae bacterium]|nr:ABC transporter ATP-binding protein [Streptosporangiaceae bacterium]